MKPFPPILSTINKLSKTPVSDYPLHVKQKIRDKAIERAEKNFIMYGRKLEELSISEYESCVREEEEKIWSGIKKKSFSAVLLLFGIAI